MNPSHIKTTLDTFTSHLRLDRERYTLTDVARKYVALGVNVVPTQWVYDVVASDYALLALKTHNPPLNEYADPRAAPLDVATFSEIIKNGFDAKRSAALLESAAEFQAFVDSVVFPPPQAGGKQKEKWIEASRTDKWKDVALFLSQNYKEHTQFDALLKRITDQKDVSDLRKRMRAYKPTDKRVLAVEMGRFIASLQLNDVFVEHVEAAVAASTTTPTKADTMNDSVVVAADATTNKPFTFTEADALFSLCAFKTQMEDYRKRAGLGVIVEPKRIAHQMFCAAICQAIPTELLLRSQQRLEPIKGEAETNLVLDIAQTDAFDTKRLEEALPLSRRAQCVAQACNKWTWSARVLVSYVIDPKSHMSQREYARFERLMSHDDKGEQAFIHALLK